MSHKEETAKTATNPVASKNLPDSDDEAKEIAAAIEASVKSTQKKSEDKGKTIKRDDDDIVKKDAKAAAEALNKTVGVVTKGIKAGSVADMAKLAKKKGNTEKKFALSFTNNEPWKDEYAKIDKKFAGLDANTMLDTMKSGGLSTEKKKDKKSKKKQAKKTKQEEEEEEEEESSASE